MKALALNGSGSEAEGPKLEARKADCEDRILGEGAASSLPTNEGV